MVAGASVHVAPILGEAVPPAVERPRMPALRTNVLAVCHERDAGIVPPFRLSLAVDGFAHRQEARA